MPNAYHTILTAIFFFFLVFITENLIGQSVDTGIKGESIEDWETGDFDQYNWQFEGTADWLITDVTPYEGIYSAQSGDVSDNQSSSLTLEYTVYAEDTLSFWYKVSSEASYDYLNFYIDNNLKDGWSGTIPWSYAEFIVPVGTHTFKWEYDKDYSVSSGLDATWIDMITFPPEEIEASFNADTTVICVEDTIHFIDKSIGPINEWSWIFEGGTPATSNEQSPVIVYNTAGIWDVTLEVTDGVESASYFYDDFIQVGMKPSIANTPVGISSLCASWGNTTYSTIALGGNVSAYDWILDPPDAGTVSGNGSTNITMIWEPDFLGSVDLAVAGINYCGIGTYSNPLTITRYLPEVTVMLPAYVGLPEPPFQLTSGTPQGGTYEGPGVSNGWFDPAAAGMGEHTITYTYTDLNSCTNSATDIITVTEFVGMDENISGQALSLFPNPNTGKFIIQVNEAVSQDYNILIYSALNKVVYQEEKVKMGGNILKNIDLDLTRGIYFIRIKGVREEYSRKIIVR